MNDLSVQEQRVLTACKRASSKKPLTRFDLKDITKLSDRNNRELIGRLRDKGYRVIGGESGYWYARSDKQYADWVLKYQQYALTIINRVKAMDGHVDGQVSMNEQV